jgi:Domain of unknown function (DUF4440)
MSDPDYLTSASAMADLRALNARFIHNFVTNDVASHDAMLHRDFLYIRSNGARVDRATYLRNWATGFDRDIIPYWDTRDEHITQSGPVALVRATNKYVERHGETQVTGMASYTDVYLYADGVWKCLQAQITSVAEPHWPGDDTIISVYLQGQLQPRNGPQNG